MINLKTAHEIDLMARAGSLLASVLPPLKEACEPGVKTIELDRIADRLIREGGATPGFLAVTATHDHVGDPGRKLRPLRHRQQMALALHPRDLDQGRLGDDR